MFESSPFNVRVPIVLDTFNDTQCQELNQRYGHILSDDQAERLRMELLNGHPSLTRLAYYRLTRPGGPSLTIYSATPCGWTVLSATTSRRCS